MTRGLWSVVASVCLLSTVANAGTGILQNTDDGGGEYLFSNQQITKGCFYRTVFQTDGNLVTYDGNGAALWATGTSGGYAHVTFTGNLMVKNWSDQIVWQTHTSRSCDLNVPVKCTWSNLRQGDDGSLKVIHNNTAVLWSSGIAAPVTTGSCSTTPERVTRVSRNVNRPGGDIRGFFITEPRPSWCGGYCALEGPSCKAYTYVPPGVQGANAVCWLKHTVTPAVNQSGMVSGEVLVR
jgi:hypothetical protein